MREKEGRKGDKTSESESERVCVREREIERERKREREREREREKEREGARVERGRTGRRGAGMCWRGWSVEECMCCASVRA